MCGDGDDTVELRVGDEVLQAQIKEGEIDVQQGTDLEPDAVFRTDMPTYLGLLQGQIQPEEAISGGRIQIEGDAAALSRFVNYCGLPDSRR